MRFWQRLRYVEGEREGEAVLLGAASQAAAADERREVRGRVSIEFAARGERRAVRLVY
jgi:hypothetical protein